MTVFEPIVHATFGMTSLQNDAVSVVCQSEYQVKLFDEFVLKTFETSLNNFNISSH